MSYCVHCGVKLADNEKDCPLCFTPVIDPKKIDNPDYIPSFPERLDKPHSKLNLPFVSFLAALLLLFPLMVVIILDVFANRNLTWSLNVLGAEACIWAFLVLPVNFPKISPYLHITLCSSVTLGYIFLIYTVSHGNRWFLSLALPIVAIAFIFAILNTALFRNKKRNKITKSGYFFLLLAVLLVGIDISIVNYATLSIHLSWSWYVAIPIFVFGALLVLISRSPRICEWIRRKLFI